MNKLLPLLMLLLSLMANAQDNEDKKYYKYTIVSYTESMDNDDFTVKIDDGLTIDYFRGSNKQKFHVSTPAAALLYFESLGWQLVQIGVTPKEQGAVPYLTYWVFKCPCSKEEYDKVIQNAVR